MKEQMSMKTRASHLGTAFGIALLFTLAPIAAQAGQTKTAACNALVSMGNNLYLVSSTGKVLTQFTSDATAKDYAVIAPDGGRVAYAVRNNHENTYQVIDSDGQQGAFPVYSVQSKAAKNYDAMGPLMGLWWSSNDVLRLEKHISPTASRFEFHRINGDLTGSAPMIGKPAYGDGCALERNGGRTACVRGGDVTINGEQVFHVSEFAGKMPMASFTLTKGNTTTTSGNPSFRVTVVGFYKNSVGINVLLPNGNGGKTYLSGSNDFLRLWWKGQSYGFSAILVNKSKGLVRINVVKGNDVYHKTGFSPAVVWQPRGPGLLLVRQAGASATLDLIQPRESTQHGHQGRGKGHEWGLIAKAPINMPSAVKMMRFVTPSMILLQTTKDQFGEMPIHIANGRDHGKPSLSVGKVKPLPSTRTVTIDGKSETGKLLDWSCQAKHGDAD